MEFNKCVGFNKCYRYLLSQVLVREHILKSLKYNLWNIALMLELFMLLGTLKYILGLDKSVRALRTWNTGV